MRYLAKLLSIILCITSFVYAENYLINGGQESQISYQMTQKVVPASGTQKLVLSYVIPASYSSPTYNQKIMNFNLSSSINPNSQDESTDNRGNKIVKMTWKNPGQPITTTISLTALNSTKLGQIETGAPFPLTNIPSNEKVYLQATNQVPSNNSQIIAKAKALTTGSKTEFDAVQKILAWVVDHMSYVLVPKSYEALYSFQTGKGNCQNYSHLAAALMRSVGIPARIVNGVTLKQPYDVRTSGGVMTLRMAQGRHSWIEVYFPDLGWVPFDPQQTALYVSNRFIRVEIGMDNEETANDGLIRWTQKKGQSGTPRFEEVVDANFVSDQIQLNAQKQQYGPQKTLFVPPVKASFTKITVPPPPPPPPAIPPEKLKQINYRKPFIFGNLEFPEKIDFLSPRGPAQQTAGGQMEMRKNFLVETAEYVTTRGNQYAQTFILKKPVKVTKTGLALHNFGGDGQLWIEIYKDDNNGKPGQYIATSDFMPLAQIPYTSGYNWVDFNFTDGIILSPGRYWMAMGFTGSPIINWFFTYGKPVGPADGTRYKTLFDDTWSRSLAYEFNYRIIGLTQ